MAKRVAGTLFVSLNGGQFEVSLSSVEVPLLQQTRESVMSTTGLAGYKELAQRQFIKFTAIATPDFPRQALEQLSNGVLTIQSPNGMTYTLSGAYLEGETKINTFDGTVDMEFTGTVGAWS